jgi:hypothetical protein
LWEIASNALVQMGVGLCKNTFVSCQHEGKNLFNIQNVVFMQETMMIDEVWKETLTVTLT